MAPIEVDLGRVAIVGGKETFVRDDSDQPLKVRAGEVVNMYYKQDGQSLKLKVTNSSDDRGGVLAYHAICNEDGRNMVITLIENHEAEIVLVTGEKPVSRKFQHPRTGVTIGFKARHLAEIESK